VVWSISPPRSHPPPSAVRSQDSASLPPRARVGRAHLGWFGRASECRPRPSRRGLGARGGSQDTCYYTVLYPNHKRRISRTPPGRTSTHWGLAQASPGGQKQATINRDLAMQARRHSPHAAGMSNEPSVNSPGRFAALLHMRSRVDECAPQAPRKRHHRPPCRLRLSWLVARSA